MIFFRIKVTFFLNKIAVSPYTTYIPIRVFFIQFKSSMKYSKNINIYLIYLNNNLILFLFYK